MKSKVLIIDDNEMMRSFLQHILGNHFNVIIASSGEQAIQILKQGDQLPELVLTDFDLEGMSGLDLLKFIKSSTSYNHLPVIILSGRGNQNSRARCMEAGALDFIAKPFNPTELQTRLVEALSVSS